MTDYQARPKLVDFGKANAIDTAKVEFIYQCQFFALRLIKMYLQYSSLQSSQPSIKAARITRASSLAEATAILFIFQR